MTPDVSTLERDAKALVVQTTALTIGSPEAYTAAGETIKAVAVFMKRVHELMDPIVAATHAAHQVAVRQRDALLRPAEGARRILGERMAAWDAHQTRLAHAAALAAQLERTRQEADARERAAREQARLRREAEDRRLADAEALEARGDVEAAARLLEQPVPVDLVVPAPVFVATPATEAAAPAVEGVSFRDIWDFEITDASLIPAEYLLIDKIKLGAVVRAMRGQTNIPGVRVFPRRVAAVRTR